MVANEPIVDIRNIADVGPMKRSVALSLAFVGAALPGTVSAQLTGEKNISGCILVGRAGAQVNAEGRLTLRHMSGPPNFESIRGGDEDRLTLILVLPVAVCINDGGDFAKPKLKFATVHVFTLDPAIDKKLRRLVGRRVRVSGDGNAQNNGLQYAPLVLEAKSVTASK